MDERDKRDLMAILVTWYGPQAKNWQMTDEVLSLVMIMIKEARSCTTAMTWVPEPITFGNALSQIAKSSIKRFLSRLKDDSQVYKSCNDRVLLNYKSKIAMAGMGI